MLKLSERFQDFWIFPWLSEDDKRDRWKETPIFNFFYLVRQLPEATEYTQNTYGSEAYPSVPQQSCHFTTEVSL